MQNIGKTFSPASDWDSLDGVASELANTSSKISAPFTYTHTHKKKCESEV